MVDAAIRIDGLSEFRKGLKDLDKDLPKALRLAFNEAADIVASDARRQVPSRSGRARKSVKARSTQSRARVVGGSSRAPYYPWLDFGGKVGRNHSVTRPYRKDGRYIYPAYKRRSSAGEFQEALSRGIQRVARDAGIEVT